MRHNGSGAIGNRLLAALPPADFDLLVPELETVVLNQDAVLSREGDPTWRTGRRLPPPQLGARGQ